ncbi:HupE/UreJ family protein [bacterium]|nr:HupE/UreJ family protein [bacterium]
MAPRVAQLALGASAFLWSLVDASQAFAHGVSSGDQAFIQQNAGMQIIPFIYLGAKHMVTGYDHLLFLVGVIFFLYRMKDVWHYVTLFAIGHSLTLIVGVAAGINVNAYIVDAIIGLSVVYKALDNIGGLERVLGFRPNPRAMVLVFGFFHGFGLATKLQEFELSREGLIPNILAFNVGVETGQVLALSAVLILMTAWRRRASFQKQAFSANVALMTAGFVLIGYQLSGLVAG